MEGYPSIIWQYFHMTFCYFFEMFISCMAFLKVIFMVFLWLPKEITIKMGNWQSLFFYIFFLLCIKSHNQASIKSLIKFVIGILFLYILHIGISFLSIYQQDNQNTLFFILDALARLLERMWYIWGCERVLDFFGVKKVSRSKKFLGS